jgi:hypothetical protein
MASLEEISDEIRRFLASIIEEDADKNRDHLKWLEQNPEECERAVELASNVFAFLRSHVSNTSVNQPWIGLAATMRRVRQRRSANRFKQDSGSPQGCYVYTPFMSMVCYAIYRVERRAGANRPHFHLRRYVKREQSAPMSVGVPLSFSAFPHAARITPSRSSVAAIFPYRRAPRLRTLGYGSNCAITANRIYL